MQLLQVSARHSLLECDPREHLDSFATAVEVGLAGDPKSLTCRFLYDEVGSALFEEICELPEYYPTRAERELLEAQSDAIVARLPTPVVLVELGSGSSSKTRLLIDALLRRQSGLRYVPVDISRTALDEAAQALLAEYERLEIHAIAGEYEDGLEHLRRHERDLPRVIAWLGSNVGNFDRPTATRFLSSIRLALSERDALLVGIDLRKDAAVLERAYDDPAGVTARFNLNLLDRINRELGGHFDTRRFEHHAHWREAEGRVEMGLVSRCDQRVAIDGLDKIVSFAAGETIHTEDSYKYSLAEIEALASGAGLVLAGRWLDAGRRYSLNLLRPA